MTSSPATQLQDAALGWGPSVAVQHGPLLVVGVFGTVISLERAVALAKPWAFAAPALSALGAVSMMAGLSFAPWLSVASCIVAVLVHAVIIRGRPRWKGLRATRVATRRRPLCLYATAHTRR